MARILIVDDDAKITQMLELCLRPKNHEIVIAADGQIALKKALEKKPQLIIADIMMPNMDGPTFISNLWEELNDRSIPVIFLSGLISKAEQKAQNELFGNQFFLAKPFSAAELNVLVERALA
ncbi:response regulator [Turneriella parva]|uniref:Response regulator receiver protein n=1 Tax=Turneriella parva (strain ATCC BAA-1111 / DSM 21527 / NCTC 11395 / H) TaxID=869212 RepID=I4B3D4_TURPD|nr:response regulator [Turneriella parva]AFM11791.1 response regulator receiver protein [Turneriella parva DSM 21527]